MSASLHPARITPVAAAPDAVRRRSSHESSRPDGPDRSPSHLFGLTDGENALSNANFVESQRAGEDSRQRFVFRGDVVRACERLATGGQQRED
jgi:hypothetical protein